MESSPADILRSAYERVSGDVTRPIVTISDIAERIETVSRSATNRACVRVLLACSLAKSSHPEVDIRKPYTEIGDSDAFAGRSYDERYLQPFIIEHQLPCNPTTAFLTPAFRNRNITLTPDLNMVGRPPLVYKAVLQLLTDVYEGRVSAEDLLAETVRRLLIMKNEQLVIRNSLLADLSSSTGALPLSSEDIITIIEQHLKSPNSSRLPVLVVAAAYEAAKDFLGEKILSGCSCPLSPSLWDVYWLQVSFSTITHKAIFIFRLVRRCGRILSIMGPCTLQHRIVVSHLLIWAMSSQRLETGQIRRSRVCPLA